jgi:hypothetical protein
MTSAATEQPFSVVGKKSLTALFACSQNYHFRLIRFGLTMSAESSSSSATDPALSSLALLAGSLDSWLSHAQGLSWISSAFYGS